MPFMPFGITRVSAFSLLSIFHPLTNTTLTSRSLMIVTPLLPPCGFALKPMLPCLILFMPKDFGALINLACQPGKNAHSLMIKQKFEWNEYNFGFGIYKSFGNANWMIGYHGNRLGFDFWTNTAYANTLNSLSYMMDANAFTCVCLWRWGA